MQNLNSQRNLQSFEDLIHNILEGLNKNPSVHHKSLLLIAYGLIKDSLEIIDHSKKIDYLVDNMVVENNPVKLKYNMGKTLEILEESGQNRAIFESI